MKTTTEFALNQSLLMTTDMRLAIGMLAMSTDEIEDLINDELIKNPCLEEDYDYYHHHISKSQEGAFDIAVKTCAAPQDFRQNLLTQMGEGKFNAIEATIATMLIHSLDDDGILSDYEHVFYWISEELGVYPEWIESVRLRILDLEPMGCGAKNINESLMHQIQRKCAHSHEQFMAIMDCIAKNPAKKITQAQLAHLNQDTKRGELKKLCPQPSSAQIETPSFLETINPDVMVTTHQQIAKTTLLKRPSERITINKKTTLTFLKDHHRRAQFTSKALRFRENNLLAVAKLIVEQQQDWFVHNKPLKPLSLRDIAVRSGLHESSISRLSRGKYLSCDRGVFELKYFFNQAVTPDSNNDLTASSVKEHIKIMVAKENKSAPLSDQNICEELQKNGMPIARRTVSKYRKKLNIPPKSERVRVVV